MITRQNIPLHVGEVGIGFAPATFGGAGGTPPYTWSIGGGALPPGLSISPGGSVSGTPTASGSFGYTLLLSDSAGAAAGYATSVTILPRLAASGLCTQQCAVEAGCVTVCGAFGDISGGLQPYSYTLIQGSLPVGMSLNGLALAGTFPAPPPTGTAPPPYSFSVGVTDSFGATASVSAVFNVYQHVSLASGGCSTPYGTPCTTQLAISGGIPGATFSVALVANNPPGPNQGCGSFGPAPPGSLSVTGSNVVINIPGTWPAGSGYGAIWTLQVTDSSLCGPSTKCSSNQATAVVEVACS